jgi:O-antigen/teichoic acid export membrane protein
MITMDKQKIILYAAIFGLFFNVTLNLFLIPSFGYLGAAVATIAVELMVFLLLSVCMYRVIQDITGWVLVGKSILSLLIPVLVVAWLFPGGLLYLKIVLINLCFLVLLYFLGVFEQEELETVSNLLFLRKRLFGLK